MFNKLVDKNKRLRPFESFSKQELYIKLLEYQREYNKLLQKQCNLRKKSYNNETR